MYCHKCGKKLPDGAKFCDECGANLRGGATSDGRNNNAAPNIGWIAYIIISLAMLFWALNTYSNDTSRLFGYSYRPPLTGHEVFVIVVGIFGCIGMVAGIIDLCSPKLQNSNKPDLTAQGKPKATLRTARKLTMEGHGSVIKCSRCGKVQAFTQTLCKSCGAEFVN